MPGYLPDGEHPRSVAALVAHTAHVLGVPLPVDLGESIRCGTTPTTPGWRGNDRLRGYVELLEEHYDSRIEQAVTDTDLATHFEELLSRRDASPADDD